MKQKWRGEEEGGEEEVKAKEEDRKLDFCNNKLFSYEEVIMIYMQYSLHIHTILHKLEQDYII